MAGMPAVSIDISIVTAIASIPSVVGSGFILICYSILPLNNHFRHVLILNLAVADFLNSLNNSVSGLYILASKTDLHKGPICVFNGVVCQITVQATDCAVLAIAICTVLSITRRGPISTMPQGVWQRNWIVLVCCAIWAFPFFTGFLALGMGWYAPATGNWCWITAEPVYLRYVLTHGWRFLFIAIEICLYIYLDRHLRRHYQALAAEIPSADTQNNLVYTSLSQPQPHSAIRFDVDSPSSTMDITTKPADKDAIPAQQQGIRTTTCSFSRISEPHPHSEIRFDVESPSSTMDTAPKPADKDPIPAQQQGRTTTWSFSRISGLRKTHSFSTDARYQAIQRALLLNAYPLAYIILLLPGLANRLVEASGHTSYVTQFMQAATQLIGLANALTYGWNEQVAKQLKERFNRS